MKSTKKLLSILLVLALAVSLFSGCGNSEQVDDNDDSVGTKTEDTKSEDSTDDNQTDTTETEVADEEMAEITMMILSLAPMGEGVVAVEEAVNAITEAEINTHVTLQYVEPGQYSQQLNLALAGNEDIDIIHLTPIPPAGFSALTSNNALVPLDDLMDKYGQETLDILGDLVRGTSINGEIYALPCNRDMAMAGYTLMRTDMLEETGLLEKAQNMKTWSEYEEILTTITDKYDVYGTGNVDAEGTVITSIGMWYGEDSFADNSVYDNLGDSQKLIASDENGKVLSYYETEDYQKMIARVRDWYEKGLVYPDAAMSEDLGDILIKNNVIFAQTIIGELGADVTHGAAAGHDLTGFKITSAPIGSGNIRKFGWAIPTVSKEQEAAAKMLNLMYTNTDINNILAWGIEGRDYEVVDGVAKFPEGVSAENVAYHTADFLYGNQFITLPWDGNPANIRDMVEEEMEACGVSQYLGFSADTTVITNELTALTNVTNEYVPGLAAGILSENDYNDFIAKLKASGIDKVVAEYQKQLDEWLANQ